MSATYGRNARFDKTEATQAPQPKKEEVESDPKGIYLDGYSQVIDLLRAADPEFRNSLLARLTRRDPKLGQSLRDDLGI